MDTSLSTDCGAHEEYDSDSSDSSLGDKSETDPSEPLSFILLGNKQVGKSATGNTILGQEAFISKKSSRPTAQDVTVKSGNVNGFPVTVYDTPGFCDSKMSEEEIRQIINEKILQKCKPGLYAFLLVMKADTFTEEDRKNVERIEKILGENHLENTWILFTRGDELQDDNMTIQELIDENEELKTLVQKYDHRYHVFNNRIKGSTDQARILLVNILKRLLGENYEMILTKHNPETHKEPGTCVSSLPSMKIVLLGKTGFGKSASGNTILGQKMFFSKLNTNSVTSVCSVKDATVSGRSVSVVDTPGFFDTQMNCKELMVEIAKSVYLSSPGPHAFLIVLRANDRFTEHEQQIPQLIEIMFGQKVLKYSIILFTHGDLLEGTAIEELINGNCNLRHLVQKCGGRYQLFNNKDLNNREQVNDLLQKIDSMIKQNGGGHYSNRMYEDAHRFRQEEEQRKLREEKEKKLKEASTELQMTEKYKPKQHENPEFKKFYRRHLSFLRMTTFAIRSFTAGQVAGFCIGGVIGIVGGPVGMLAGAAIGSGVGAVSGLLAGTVISALRRDV